MAPPRTVWLSLTPEPERELPAAMAALRAGGAPTGGQVAAERARAERLVVGGSRRQWMRWMGEAGTLAEEAAGATGDVALAREVALDVIENHHALMLGLPGRHDEAAEHARRRVAAARAGSEETARRP